MKTLLILAVATVLLGCGRGTDAGKVFVPETGHPDAWASHLVVDTPSFHGTFIKTVPSASAGATLFVLHCAPCHGNDGSGKIGPNIQAVTLPLIVSAIQNKPVMSGHSILTSDELHGIADYITTLSGNIDPIVGTFDPVLCRQCHGTNLDGGIALVSCFACHNGPDGNLGHPVGWSSAHDQPAGFHGTYGRDFPSGCTTCHGVDLEGGFVYLSSNGNKNAPGCSSCHDGVIAAAL